MNKNYKKKLFYFLFLITILLLSSPKTSIAFVVDGWYEWQSTGIIYNHLS